MEDITLTLIGLDAQSATFESINSGDGATSVVMPFAVWVGNGRPTQIVVSG